jgi:sugar transferase (PEP-CTERM system associated)
MTRPVVFWISWRTLVDLLADFSFLVVVTATGAQWAAGGLPIDRRAMLMYAAILAGVMASINAWLGLYQRIHYRSVYESRARAVLSLHLSVPIAAGVLWALHVEPDMKNFLELAAMAGLFGILSNRVRRSHASAMPVRRERVLVYGVGDRAKLVREAIEQNPGAEIVGFFANRGSPTVSLPADKIITGDRSLRDTVRELNIDEIVVAVTERRGGMLPLRELLDCKLQGVRVNDVASYFEETMGQIRLDALYAGWLIFGDGFRQPPLRNAIKRAFDIAFSGSLLLISAPAMLLATLLIVLESGFPVFYRQERVGLNGRLFNVIKFRSMRKDAEKDGKPRWASARDDRVTRVGRFMRKTRIDELPQLFSVLLGHMSLVGPRPERPYFVDQLTNQIPFYAVRHCVKPGVTGWAQVRYHYGASVEDAAGKLQYDLYYVKNHSLALDLVVLFETVGVVLNAKGAH